MAFIGHKVDIYQRKKKGIPIENQSIDSTLFQMFIATIQTLILSIAEVSAALRSAS